VVVSPLVWLEQHQNDRPLSKGIKPCVRAA
jgi:hypothetical protein